MLKLLTKRFFDISLLFKLKYAAISLMLWTVNKSCYNDSLCLHEYTKMIGFKKKRNNRKSRNNFYFSAESTFQESVSRQNFYACARAKKAISQRHSTCIPSCIHYIPLAFRKIAFIQTKYYFLFQMLPSP